MVNLLNKKVLLLIPKGRGIYGTGVAGELERRGAIVTVYDERPSTSTISKAALRLFKKLINPYLYNYFKNIILKNENANFDYVLIVRGEGLTPKTAQMFRKAFKKATFILYLWDSLISNNTTSIFPYFDKILTFDKTDAETYPNLISRPLFFLPDYGNIAESKERTIDVLFIGTVHSDRFAIIKNLLSFFETSNLKTFYYLYFPSKILFFRKKLMDPAFKNSKLKDFKYMMLSSEQAAAYLAKARASLDMQEPNQIGLTMRTIEVLGAKRKLITTNRIIESYDFYDSRNILIIDRNNPKIDPSFIHSPYCDIPKEIYNKYSLKGWIDDVFS